MRNHTTDTIDATIGSLNHLHPITTLEQLCAFFIQLSYNPNVFDINYPQSCLDIDGHTPYCGFHTVYNGAVVTIYGWFSNNQITFHSKY